MVRTLAEFFYPTEPWVKMWGRCCPWGTGRIGLWAIRGGGRRLLCLPLFPGSCAKCPVLLRHKQRAEKVELEPAFISVGITGVSWQWECLASLSAPTGLKLLVLDMGIYVTVAELTVLGSTGAL